MIEPTFRPSSLYKLKSHSYLPKILIFMVFIMYILVIVACYISFKIDTFFVAFLIVANFIILLFSGNYLFRAILFPYANYFIRKKIDSTINRRFAREFARQISLMHAILKVFAKIEDFDYYIDQKHGANKKPAASATEASQEQKRKQVDRKRVVPDMNQKMFSAVEMLEIYVDVNSTIINQNRRNATSSYFRQATLMLSNIKLKVQELSISFPEGSILEARHKTLWNYYNKDMIDEDQQDKAVQQQLPFIPNTEENLKIIEEVGQYAEEFKRLVNQAARDKCFCCYCRYTPMFGTLDQSLLMLEKNFEGKQFLIDGYNGVKLDCMFIPCTNDECQQIKLDTPQGDYLYQPTFIICNPNALIYQQMVTAPNSYWLSFFLKRGINVMCWNYRGYGLSRMSLCSAKINPYNCKLDAEKVLEFLIKKIQVKGKIGVYGRSLGGIASTHLANKFPDHIKALLVDRTFCELDLLSERKIPGRCTRPLYRFISFNWKALNDRNFAEAQCYKILTCDPQDDVVDNFSSLPVGVAMHLAHNSYDQTRWKKFFQYLCFLYDTESKLFSKLHQAEIESFAQKIGTNFQESVSNFSPRGTGSRNSNTINNDGSSTNSHNHSIDNDVNDATQNLLLKDNTSDIMNENKSIRLSILRQKLDKSKSNLELHYIVNRIMVVVNELSAGTIQIKEILNGTKTRDFKEFKVFLQVLEIYGTGFEDDISTDKFHNRAQICHKQQTITTLETVIEIHNQSLIYLGSKPHSSGDLKLRQGLILMLQAQLEGFQELLNIQQKKGLQTDYDNLEQGHLVMMKCGHRGKPSRIEEKRISRLLRKSGFIPMLEEIYKQQNSSLVTNNKLSDKSYDQSRMDSSKMTINNQSMDGIKLGINLELQPNARMFLKQNSSSYLQEQDKCNSKESLKDESFGQFARPAYNSASPKSLYDQFDSGLDRLNSTKQVTNSQERLD